MVQMSSLILGHNRNTCSVEVVDHGPVLPSTEQRTREYHAVERYVILGHEVCQLHLFWILPPFLPLSSIVGCDGDVADRRIIPDIKHLNIETDYDLLTF